MDFSALPNLTELIHRLHGQRVLHIGHTDADCDALGSAYAMSQVIPGDVGFAEALKVSALDLAHGLGLTPRINPNPADYDYVLIYDTPTSRLLGLPLPERYGLFDHHVPNGHRFSQLTSELAPGAEFAWVAPVESTCSLLVELFVRHDIPITRPMGLALAAGLVTDTDWLRLANGDAFGRMATITHKTGLYLEDVMHVIDNPHRRAEHRSAVIAALRDVHEHTVGRWGILAAATDSHDNAFSVLSALARLPADVRIVVFPKHGQQMAMLECDAALIYETGLDMSAIARKLTDLHPVHVTWGTPLWGRVILPLDAATLLERSIAAVVQALENPS